MPPPSPKPRVGLRDVARGAGVCLMTASLAMRNNPKITPATRERVRTVADRLGYRPDPEIARLMGRLRQSRQTRGSEVVAMLDLRPPTDPVPHPYDAAVRRGVARRADALGFGVSLFQLSDYDGHLAKLLRVVRARGIGGLLLLLPSHQNAIKLPGGILWDGLSVVAATTAVLTPRFHRVGPNQLFNMVSLLETMHARGHRKISAVFNEILDQRTAHQYTMALAWHGHRERILLLPGDSLASDHGAAVAAWLHRHKPDLVVAQKAELLVPLVARRGRRPPALVSLTGENELNLPYQDQLPELIGETAVSLLTGMMHNHETGIPHHAHVMTIDGALREAAGH